MSPRGQGWPDRVLRWQPATYAQAWLLGAAVSAVAFGGFLADGVVAGLWAERYGHGWLIFGLEVSLGAGAGLGLGPSLALRRQRRRAAREEAGE